MPMQPHTDRLYCLKHGLRLPPSPLLYIPAVGGCLSLTPSLCEGWHSRMAMPKSGVWVWQQLRMKLWLALHNFILLDCCVYSSFWLRKGPGVLCWQGLGDACTKSVAVQRVQSSGILPLPISTHTCLLPTHSPFNLF